MKDCTVCTELWAIGLGYNQGTNEVHNDDQKRNATAV